METSEKTKLGTREGIVSIIVNILLFVIKYWAGIVSGSIALIADAWHTLSDSLSSGFVIAGVKLSAKKPDRSHPFGYGRWEQISAIFIGFLLGIVAYEFLRESIERLSNHETAVFGPIAIIVTIVSVIVKELLAQYAFWISRKTGLRNVYADGWHHRSDALSSVIILVGIFLKDYFWWIDSILGIIVSILIFYTVYEIVKDAIIQLLGLEPSPELIAEIKEQLKDMSGMDLEPHHFHIHDYGLHKEMTFHIKLQDEMNIKKAHDIATEIEKKINIKYDVITTIHIEPKTYRH